MRFFFLIIFGLAAISCDNPTVVTPGAISQNIVTGMFLTSESGPESIAVWGNPDFPGQVKVDVEPSNEDDEQNEQVYIPVRLALDTPYPNPSDGNFTVSFQLPSPSRISVWIETAYWSGENAILPMQPRVEKAFQRFVLAENQWRTAGSFSIRFPFRSTCRGGEMEPGFYRVFLRVNNTYILWRDIYIAGAKNETPPSLQRISHRMVARNCTDIH